MLRDSSRFPPFNHFSCSWSFEFGRISPDVTFLWSRSPLSPAQVHWFELLARRHWSSIQSDLWPFHSDCRLQLVVSFSFCSLQEVHLMTRVLWNGLFRHLFSTLIVPAPMSHTTKIVRFVFLDWLPAHCGFAVCHSYTFPVHFLGVFAAFSRNQFAFDCCICGWWNCSPLRITDKITVNKLNVSHSLSYVFLELCMVTKARSCMTRILLQLNRPAFWITSVLMRRAAHTLKWPQFPLIFFRCAFCEPSHAQSAFFPGDQASHWLERHSHRTGKTQGTSYLSQNSLLLLCINQLW